jgi:hypothetical protein
MTSLMHFDVLTIAQQRKPNKTAALACVILSNWKRVGM